MSCSRYIVDIRRHRGESAYVIELVGRFCSRTPGAAVDWMVRPDQARLLPSAHVIGQADQCDINGATRICERLVQLGKETQNGGASGPFWVLSYDNYVLAEASKLKSGVLPVETLHLGILRRITQTPLQPGWGNSSFPLAGLPSLPERLDAAHFTTAPTEVGTPLAPEEAIDLAKNVLRRGGHISPDTALPQTDLRPRMCFLDGRAAKRLGDPASESLIPTIVDTGLQDGWLKKVKRNPNKPETAALYLIDLPSLSGRPNAEAPALGAVPDAPAALVRPAELASTVAATTEGQEIRERAEAPSAQNSAPKPSKHPNAATAFEAVLSKSRIGSMPETRDLIFDAVEEVVESFDGKPILINELFTRAVLLAKDKAASRNYVAEHNWPVAERCIRRLMVWAGVLIGKDERPIVDTIGINASLVLSLAPDFRRICEAFLVQHIIEKNSGISFDDHPYYLGLTLYRRGRARAVSADELKAKADGILVYLVEKGRIEMDGDRIIRVKTQSKLLSIA